MLVAPGSGHHGFLDHCSSELLVEPLQRFLEIRADVGLGNESTSGFRGERFSLLSIAQRQSAQTSDSARRATHGWLGLITALCDRIDRVRSVRPAA